MLVEGGEQNSAGGVSASVIGGKENAANGMGSTVIGGHKGEVLGEHSVIVGGFDNRIGILIFYLQTFHKQMDIRASIPKTGLLESCKNAFPPPAVPRPMKDNSGLPLLVCIDFPSMSQLPG